MERIIELVCDYCGMEITEKSHTCPNCGADCSSKIKKYKEQKKHEEEIKKIEEEKRNQELAKSVKGVASKVAIAFIVLVLVLIVIFISLVSSLSKEKKRYEEEFGANSIFETKKNKKVEVGFNEEANTDKYSVVLDSYELYEYKSNEFPNQYNTPEGYQKIAFHFIYTNNSDSKLLSTMVSLTADDYDVDKSKMEVGMFEYVAVGKDKYSQVENKYIQSGEKLQGYVGFLVPKDKKVLKFHIGEYVTITMDNPTYIE